MLLSSQSQSLRVTSRDEPGKAFAVEVDLVGNARLDEPVGVDAVAVQLEAGVVEHKVDASALMLLTSFQRRSRWLPRMFFSVAARCSHRWIGGS